MPELNKQKILRYIWNEFPEPMGNMFTYDLVDNILCYLFDSLPEDMVLYHIAEVIPEITEKELINVVT